MRTIWKQELELDLNMDVWLPAYSKLLHVGAQDEDPNHVFLWFEVNTDNPRVCRKFHVYGTGFQLKDNHQHLGTVIFNVAGIVWHVYEEM